MIMMALLPGKRWRLASAPPRLRSGQTPVWRAPSCSTRSPSICVAPYLEPDCTPAGAAAQAINVSPV